MIEAIRKAQENRRALMFPKKAVEDTPIDLSKKTHGVKGSGVFRLSSYARYFEREQEARLQQQIASLRKYAAEHPTPQSSDTAADKPLSILEVQVAFCKTTGISRMDLISHRKTKALVDPRHLCMMLCKALTIYSLPHIGRMFGGKDHTTILHALRKMEPIENAARAELAPDATLQEWIDTVLRLQKEIAPRSEGRRAERRRNTAETEA